jgi:hypothetical protein
MSVNPLLVALFTERAVHQNQVTDITLTDSVITVRLQPKVAAHHVRADCQAPVLVQPHEREVFTVQGLGIQGRAVRYVVTSTRLSYFNDAGKFVTFVVPLLGLRSDLCVTDEVVEKALYFNVDRNLSLAVTAEMLNDLYQVQTSDSALERWKTAEAEQLPTVGQLLQRLNEQKKITVLHLDEYKATGTDSWELAIRDEHGRLLFSLRLKQRDRRQMQAILRWFRMLGLDIQTVYVDLWAAYEPAIHAVYPHAHIQYDYFHIIQNIHRHLYKALTAYRRAFKAASSESAQAEVRKALHKKLWDNRYVLFTNEENLSPEQQKILDELLQEHADTIVEYIVTLRRCIRDVFNASESFLEAVERVACLMVEGWGDVSDAFGKVMAFLHDHLEHMLTYLRVPGVQRNSLSECTIRGLRRMEQVRQGFKTQHGRVTHFKLLLWRRYLRPARA